MTNAKGYLAPLEVKTTDSLLRCNVSGAIVGLHINKLENPTIALWPDPYALDKHCEVDISAYVQKLEIGEYHLASTEHGADIPFGTPVEKYIGIDPHTSVYFIKSNDPMDVLPSVKNLRVTGQ